MSEHFKILRPWIPVEKLYWKSLSVNPAAIHLLEQNPDKINWEWLSANPAAIHLLEQNPEKLNWTLLSLNPKERIDCVEALSMLDPFNPIYEDYGVKWVEFRRKQRRV